jgi:hypothetical protein
MRVPGWPVRCSLSAIPLSDPGAEAALFGPCRVEVDRCEPKVVPSIVVDEHRAVITLPIDPSSDLVLGHIAIKSNRVVFEDDLANDYCDLICVSARCAVNCRGHRVTPLR